MALSVTAATDLWLEATFREGSNWAEAVKRQGPLLVGMVPVGVVMLRQGGRG